MALTAWRMITLLLFIIVRTTQSIYCKVGYGQKIKQNNKFIDFWSRTLWVRNCPSSTFCWNGGPTANSEAAMVDLVGGDWNDDYWGDQGGFIYGCGGDFGLNSMPAKNDFVELSRACCMNESGVSVLESFRGSGRKWEFRISEVCGENLCSSGFRTVVGGVSIWVGIAISVVATYSLW